MQNKFALAKSKAGRRFIGLMRVFNTGDADAIHNFITEYITDDATTANPVEQWQEQLINIYNATDGMRVFQVVGTDEYQVAVLMQAHNNDALYVMSISVSEDYPHKISEFTHRPA